MTVYNLAEIAKTQKAHTDQINELVERVEKLNADLQRHFEIRALQDVTEARGTATRKMAVARAIRTMGFDPAKLIRDFPVLTGDRPATDLEKHGITSGAKGDHEWSVIMHPRNSGSLCTCLKCGHQYGLVPGTSILQAQNELGWHRCPGKKPVDLREVMRRIESLTKGNLCSACHAVHMMAESALEEDKP